MHLLNAATLWIPTLLILIGILLNRSGYHTLRREFREDFNSLRGEFTTLRSEFTMLRLDMTSQIDIVQSANHADSLEILKQMAQFHERVAVMESRQHR